MNIIPIVFAFDNNLIEAAGVCFSSLLMNAEPDTFYNIHILHSPNVNLDEERLISVADHYKNCSISFHKVNDTFEDAFEIRHVTKATYYRLLIPDIFPQYEKVIYADVDIIFRLDLSDVYAIDLSGNYIAATLDIGMNNYEGKYVASLPGVKEWEYIQAGFILMNLENIRKDNIVSRFIQSASNNYKYQDQDILNIVCAGKIKLLPPCWNVNDCAYIQFFQNQCNLPVWISREDIETAKKTGNIHYSGYKPWNRYSVAFDIWWEYYRKSPLYDEKRYFKFFFDKTMLLDSLTLWKRVKNLIRFFLHGRYKG